MIRRILPLLLVLPFSSAADIKAQNANQASGKISAQPCTVYTGDRCSITATGTLSDVKAEDVTWIRLYAGSQQSPFAECLKAISCAGTTELVLGSGLALRMESYLLFPSGPGPSDTITANALAGLKVVNNGGGKVTSSPSGIDCGSTCSTGFNWRDQVSLTASPAEGYAFDSWNGDCSGQNPASCGFVMDAPRNVSANFKIKPQQFTLTVSKNGTGSGTVTSSPTGIDCGSTCSASFPSNQQVTLTAQADANTLFAGWSGEGCSGTGTCVVAMSQARNITATFNLRGGQTLTINKAGSGTGTVASTPAGIDCGLTCSADFSYNQEVTLTATADSGSVFSDWSGCDSKAGNQCVVKMTQARSVTATFGPPGKQTLLVKKVGTGSGIISSQPAGIICGNTCSFDFDYGTTVTLSASANTGSLFSGWDGGGCSGTGACTVKMDQLRLVSAAFNLPNKQTLFVTKGGGGTGVITSVPVGIDCDSNCRNQSAFFDNNTTVTLTAVADSGSDFSSWSGCDSTSGSNCTVKMTQAINLIAIFNPNQFTLTITKGGSGTGTITSSSGGIDCGSSCSGSFDPGTTITLTAKADTGSTFAGWNGGGCSGTGSCTVIVNQDLEVIATFDGATQKAILISPAGRTLTSTPTYTWQAVAVSTWYQLVVWDAGNVEKIGKWHTAVEAGCGSGVGQCSITPPTQLEPGSYRWWIQTYVNGTNGPWSNELSFTVVLPLDKAVLLSPSGKTQTALPTYKWQAVAASTWYQLWVSDGANSTKINTWYTAAQVGCGSGTGVCSITPVTQLVSGSYQWWIQTFINAANGPWSEGLAFTVLPPPPKTALISPSGKTYTASPTYRWLAVSTATTYQILVLDAGNNVRAQSWYSATQAGCGSGIGQCSIVLQTTLSMGSHRWWIQASNDIGSGPWSDEMAFTVASSGPPGKATLISPAGAVGTNQPTFTWNAVPLATWYLLWVNDSTTNSGKINTWYSATQSGCASGVGPCSVKPTTTLAGGNAQWWIQTYGEGGYGPWSDALSFVVPSSGGLPGTAILVSPSGKIGTHTPTYVWKAASSATWYRLWVNDSLTMQKILTWYSAEAAGCASGNCSVTPSTILAAGVAQWWVQTWNGSGYGPWSDGMNFTVGASMVGTYEIKVPAMPVRQLRMGSNTDPSDKKPVGKFLANLNAPTCRYRYRSPGDLSPKRERPRRYPTDSACDHSVAANARRLVSPDPV